MSQNINGDSQRILNTIYDNITLHRVQYFYILPNTQESKEEIEMLQSSLKIMNKKGKRKITGGIFYCFDDNIRKLVPTEHYSVRLFISCNNNRTPILGEHMRCEGYRCFSNSTDCNEHLYEKIDAKMALATRGFHKTTEFTVLDFTA